MSKETIELTKIDGGHRREHDEALGGHVYIPPIYADGEGNVYQKTPEGDLKLIHEKEEDRKQEVLCAWCGDPIEHGDPDQPFHDLCYDQYLDEVDRKEGVRAAPLVNKAMWEV